MIAGETNQFGAMLVAVGDRLRAATEEAAQMPASFPAALSALRTWADGATVDVLADGLRLSHSRAVRVVDRLESEGLARRHPDAEDRRAVRVRLTARGRSLADRVQLARAGVLETALGGLSGAQRRALEDIVGLVLTEVTDDRRDARGICRLCDPVACGHETGHCPVTRAAARKQATAQSF
jgi:DNA-binding MarR family transcriptional regulator